MEAVETLSHFPDRLGPIFVRDLRQGLRAQYFLWAFLILQALALCATAIEILVFQFVGDASAGGLFSGALATLLSFGFGLILPLTLFGALQSEVGRGRNIELLLTSSLSRWQIIRGKFLVASSLSLLLLVSILPYLLIRYFLGSVDLLEALALLGSTILGNATMNAIVIAASGYSNAIARVFLIGYLTIIYLVSSSITLPVFLFSGSPTPFDTVLLCLAVVLSSAVNIVFALQLARARIKLFELPYDSSIAIPILILVFLLPIIVGVAASAGGKIALFIVLALFLWLGLMIDRNPDRHRGGKRLQP